MPPASHHDSWRHRFAETLPWLTGAFVFIQLLSLRLGLLDRFFYDSMHADVQGIDFYSLPKAYLNLAVGRSAYDTFAPPAIASHITWYLAHPALAVIFGSWLSRFAPATGYGIFTLLSLAMMIACAWLLASLSHDALIRRLIWLLLLGAFPSYRMLYTGNVQALLVLALSMVFSAVYRLAYPQPTSTPTQVGHLLLAGLLLSLLTKPVVLLMLPILLWMPETRRPARRALATYLIVSLLFEIVPALNPEAIGLHRVAWLAIHPGYVHDTMNIYADRFNLTPDMKDNSIHWFNLVAQSSYRMNHIDIFSLPVFLDTLLGTRTPGWLYQLPLLVILGLTIAVARLRDTAARLHAALLLLMAISLTFFLTYPTVWEYQYTSVLPIAAGLLLVRSHANPAAPLLPRPLLNAMLTLASSLWLPSLYFLTEGHIADASTLTLIRLDRVLPATLLFILMIYTLVRITISRQPQPNP
jgi:hypothetical protein